MRKGALVIPCIQQRSFFPLMACRSISTHEERRGGGLWACATCFSRCDTREATG